MADKMEANPLGATFDPAPKYKTIINIVAPLLYMLAAGISAIVVIAHGERLDTGDLIAVVTILSVGGIWVIGTIIRYRRYFYEITIKTVVRCANGAKQTSTEDEEVRVHIVEIYMENDTHSTEKPALPDKIDETPKDGVHLCQEDSVKVPMMTCIDGKSDVKSDDDSV